VRACACVYICVCVCVYVCLYLICDSLGVEKNLLKSRTGIE